MMQKNSSRQSGFTMVELAVTMGIFVMLTSVVLANYRTFSNNADFLNVADNVALSLREAQIYGVGSKGAVVSCGAPASSFNCAYGVSFPRGGTSYIIFVDKDDSHTYETGEEVETVALPSNTIIGDTVCGTGCADGVDITFKRPDPDARIVSRGLVGQGEPGYDAGVIVIQNPTKKSRVTISRAGQISIVTETIIL